jgi:riboflavin transporter FmnP
MDTKRVALTATFAALAIVLNPDISRISIPAPFPPFLPYQVWEIPIFVAFLLFGPKPGLIIAIIGSAAIVTLHPNIIGFGGVIAMLAMLGGTYIAYRIVTRNVPLEITPSTRKTIIATTAGGIILRTGVMAVQNYFMLPLIGYPMTFVASISPLIALFNATEPLYVIPFSYILAKVIGSNLKIGNKL